MSKSLKLKVMKMIHDIHLAKQVSNQVWDQVVTKVWNKVREQVGTSPLMAPPRSPNQFLEQVRSQVWNDWNDTWDRVRFMSKSLKKQVSNWGKAGDVVSIQVGEEVLQQVKVQVWGEIITHDIEWLVRNQIHFQVLIQVDQVVPRLTDRILDQIFWDHIAEGRVDHE